MEQQDKLAAAIDYFHGQAEISDFAAEVEGYLKELHALKYPRNTQKYHGKRSVLSV